MSTDYVEIINETKNSVKSWIISEVEISRLIILAWEYYRDIIFDIIVYTYNEDDVKKIICYMYLSIFKQ